jgi:glucosamine 6-phosphate synthetase-like amidotransferase/phosphosugar isomerase protein
MQEDDEIQTIKNVLEAIEGTYSLWLLNHVSKNIYVVRCGSTLYGDLIKCEFSSYPDIGLSELDDNALYLVTQEGLTKVSGFDGNSPFFII